MLLWLVAAIATAVFMPGASVAAQQGGVNLDQCANGALGSPSSCPPGWQNGNLNPQNSTYREGDSVPFRAILTGLQSGQHTLVIQYDTTQGGKHAYDYLTSFSRTVPGVDPCDGIASCNSADGANFDPIPVSNNPTVPSIGVVSDAQRFFTIWNGSITNAVLGGASDVAGEQQSITVTFISSSPDVVIAWGGHVADEITWPHATAAGAINGSPYHMRVLTLDGDTSGHQDRSMKTDLTAPSLVTDVESSNGESETGAFVGSIQSGDAVSDNATLSGDKGAVTGTVSFYACFASDGTPDCTSGGTLVAEDVTVSDGTASSGAFRPDEAGTYCFRAVYTPDAAAPYSPTAETNVVIESDGNHGECFTVGSESNLLNSSVATEIHDANGIVDAALVGSTVHDVAIVSGSGEGGTPTGSVTFAGFIGTGCSGEPSGTLTVDLVDGTASSGDVTVPSGGLSFRVHYNGSDTYNPSDGICENLSSTVAPPPPPSPTAPAVPVPPAAPPVVPPAPPAIDLAITKSGAPSRATLGNRVTWTETVTNNGPDSATGVKIADPLPAGMSFVSVTSSQGTCTGGAVVSCDLGTLAKGASATITLVTTATATGTIPNTATVVGNEAETNTANNSATASVVVNGPFVPPVRYCTAVSVSPKKTLFVGRKTTLTLKVTQNAKAAKGIRIKIKGAALAITTKPSNAKGIVKVTVSPTKAGIVTFAPVSMTGCANPRVGVTGVFTPPVTG
jgi:uncharacterized repeat protein (TIGR01451 family)